MVRHFLEGSTDQQAVGTLTGLLVSFFSLSSFPWHAHPLFPGMLILFPLACSPAGCCNAQRQRVLLHLCLHVLGAPRLFALAW